MINLKQNADGSMGLEGKDGDMGGFIPVKNNYTATSVSTSIFTAPRSMIVKSIQGRVDVAGTGGAATLSLYKAPSGTAGASGVLLHSGSYNIVGTANGVQTLALSAVAGAVNLAPGDSIFLAYTGTLTSAVGNITVTMAPA